jgi:hypothetical protein
MESGSARPDLGGVLERNDGAGGVFAGAAKGGIESIDRPERFNCKSRPCDLPQSHRRSILLLESAVGWCIFIKLK